MIFLTSFDRESNIHLFREIGMRNPTLHLRGEYQASTTEGLLGRVGI